MSEQPKVEKCRHGVRMNIRCPGCAKQTQAIRVTITNGKISPAEQKYYAVVGWNLRFV